MPAISRTRRSRSALLANRKRQEFPSPQNDAATFGRSLWHPPKPDLGTPAPECRFGRTMDDGNLALTCSRRGISGWRISRLRAFADFSPGMRTSPRYYGLQSGLDATAAGRWATRGGSGSKICSFGIITGETNYRCHISEARALMIVPYVVAAIVGELLTYRWPAKLIPWRYCRPFWRSCCGPWFSLARRGQQGR